MNYSSPRALSSGASTRGRTGRAVLAALALASAAAVLGAGFVAYDDPSLALSLANLRLCF